MSTIGHNSGFAKEHLKSFVDRIERLNKEKDDLTGDIREVFSEAKGTGFDTKVLRWLISMRKLDKAVFQERRSMEELYLSASGMLD